MHRDVGLTWIVGLAVSLAVPTGADAQALRPVSSSPSFRDVPTPVRRELWIDAPTLPTLAQPAQSTRPARRTIVTHTAIGTGAGLLIGLLLSGTDVDDDDGSVVLIWTSVGFGAGAVSGVLTWLAGRGE